MLPALSSWLLQMEMDARPQPPPRIHTVYGALKCCIVQWGNQVVESGAAAQPHVSSVHFPARVLLLLQPALI